MSARTSFLAALVAGSALAAFPVRAQPPAADPSATGDLETMLHDTVVSTPTRSSNSSSTAPAVTSTLTSEDLRRYGIRSLAEAINFLSLGMVSQTSVLGGNEQVGARGVMLLNNSQILIMINGHVINDDGQAAAALLELGSLPIELVDHIEAMLGPGSVLYGGNAMLGVIDVVTKRAAQYKGVRAMTEWSFVPKAGMERTPESGWQSRSALGGGARFELLGRPAELTLQVQYAQTHRPTVEYGPPERVRSLEASWSNPNGLLRLAFGNLDATLYVSETKRDESLRDDAPIRTNGPLGPPGADGIARRANLDVKYRRRVTTSLGLLTRLFGDVTRSEYNVLNYDGIYACPFGLPDGCVTTTTVLTPSVGGELQLTYDWNPEGSTTTMVGVTGLVRHVLASVNTIGAAPGDTLANDLYLDETERAGAAYLQQVVRVTSDLALNAGVRFDYESRFGQRLSPRVAAVYSPWTSASLKAIYSEAFRGPNIVESYFHSPTLLLRAGHLEPETVRSAEISFEQRVSTHRISYGVFRTWWSDLVRTRYYEDHPGSPPADAQVVRDAIARGELNPFQRSVLRYENIASIDNYGASAGIDGSFGPDRFQYGLNLTMAQALSETGPIDGAPRLIGNARIAYDLQGGLPTLALASAFSGRRSGRYGDPFPAELNLRAAVTGPVGAGFSFRAMFDVGLQEKATAGTPGQPEKRNFALLPSDRMTIMLGLQYQLPH
jgi:outer membrane receptor protein involved in Fe transport